MNRHLGQVLWCGCGDDFCQSFYTQPRPEGPYGPGPGQHLSPGHAVLLGYAVPLIPPSPPRPTVHNDIDVTWVRLSQSELLAGGGRGVGEASVP